MSKSTKKNIKSKRKTSRPKKAPSKKTIKSWVGFRYQKIMEWRRNLLSRRPHRSFRRTRRRDYKRSLKLPGYWQLTKEVFDVIRRNLRTLMGLAILYAVLAAILSSIIAQGTYDSLRETIDESNPDQVFGAVVPVLATFWGVFVGQITGSMSSSTNSSQQIFGVMLGLFTWLSTVWLMRAMLAGKKVRIRDGVYSSGGPIIALLFLVAILLIQLIPAAVAIVVYSAASNTGLLDQTVVLMLFGGGAILLITLSLYWAVSTMIAMIVVTLPGMYPMRAVKLAGDLVIGRRVRVVLRVLWMVILLFAVWAVVLIPMIAIDGALKSAVPVLSSLPLIPIVALFLMSLSIVFAASYTYIFYRKMVDDDAAPA